MRGVAALCVMFYHYSDYLVGPVVLGSSYLAVDFFFLLSGFVIAHAYGRKLRHGMSLRRFLLIRLVRLYPLYLIGTALGFGYVLLRARLSAAHPLGLDELTCSALLSIFMLPQLITSRLPGLFPFDLAAWSLFFELVVNVLYAATAGYWTPKRLLCGLLVVGGALAAFAWHHGSLDIGMAAPSFVGGSCRCLFGFLLGVTLYGARLDRRLQAPSAVSLLVLLTILLISFSGIKHLAYDLTCAFLIFPVLLVLSRHTNVGRLRRLCEALALLSFPLYMLHTPLLFIETGVFKVIIGSDPMFLRPISGIFLALTAILISYAVAVFIDAPARARLRQLLLPNGAPASGSTRS